MDKVHEHHDYSVKDEVISAVSGGKVTAAKVTARAAAGSSSDLITCSKCGAELFGVGDGEACPKCGSIRKARGSIH